MAPLLTIRIRKIKNTYAVRMSRILELFLAGRDRVRSLTSLVPSPYRIKEHWTAERHVTCCWCHLTCRQLSPGVTGVCDPLTHMWLSCRPAGWGRRRVLSRSPCDPSPSCSLAAAGQHWGWALYLTRALSLSLCDWVFNKPPTAELSARPAGRPLPPPLAARGPARLGSAPVVCLFGWQVLYFPQSHKTVNAGCWKY